MPCIGFTCLLIRLHLTAALPFLLRGMPTCLVWNLLTGRAFTFGFVLWIWCLH
jgi:hypothetical protein